MRWAFTIDGSFIDVDTAQENDVRLHEAIREFVDQLEREFGHIGSARYTGPAVGVWERPTDGSGTAAQAVPYTAPEQSPNTPHQNYIDDVAFDDSKDDGDGLGDDEAETEETTGTDADSPPPDETDDHLA